MSARRENPLGTFAVLVALVVAVPAVANSQSAIDQAKARIQAQQAAYTQWQNLPDITYPYQGKTFVFHPIYGAVGAYQITENDNLVNTAGPNGVFYPVQGAPDADLAKDAFKAWKAAGGATPDSNTSPQPAPGAASASAACDQNAPAKVETPDKVPYHYVVHMVCGQFAGDTLDFFPKDKDGIVVSSITGHLGSEDITTVKYTARYELGSKRNNAAGTAVFGFAKAVQSTDGTSDLFHKGWIIVLSDQPNPAM